MHFLKLFKIPLLLVALTSCSNDDARTTVAAEDVYLDYKVWAEEGREEVTCMLQFHEGGPEGASMALQAPAGVWLDGQELQSDSARLTGAYYELQQPLQAFAGEHTIVFKDGSGGEHREVFTFQPITLQTQIGERLKRGPLKLKLQGLGENDKVRVLMVDTAFTTNDINRVQPVQNGAITLQPDELRHVSTGPVTLYIIKEEERPVQKEGRGGKISITYGLKRDFDLVD
jgi:hypothetical protein